MFRVTLSPSGQVEVENFYRQNCDQPKYNKPYSRADCQGIKDHDPKPSYKITIMLFICIMRHICTDNVFIEII